MTSSTWPHVDFWDAPPRAALLLALGALLGPHGLDVLHAPTLDLLRPILPVTLAAVGLLALRADPRRVLLELVPVTSAAAALLLLLPHDAPLLADLTVRVGRAVLACGPAALIGSAGLVLLTHTASLTERRVFVLALLLVLGGLADFAAAPAILCGAVAGIVVRRLPVAAREAVSRDLEYLFRPLAAGLLIVVGARVSLSDTVLLLAALEIVLALVARRMLATGDRTADVPGMLAMAVVVDAARGLHPGFAPVVDGTVVCIVALQMATFLLVEREPRATGAAMAIR